MNPTPHDRPGFSPPQSSLPAHPSRVWLWHVLTALACAHPATAENWTLLSPNGLVKISIQTSAPGAETNPPAGKPNLTYRVEYGAEGSRKLLIAESPLGLQLQGQDLVNNLRFASAQPQKLIKENYELIHGKRRICENQGTHQTLTFSNTTGSTFEIDFRAYDNGVAFRYRIPGNGDVVQTLEADATGFALPMDAKLWLAPNDKVTSYGPAYETYYENEIAVGTPAPHGQGWEFPLLCRTADSQHWMLITEANLESNFCGTRLSSTAPNGVYRIGLPDPAEGNGHGSEKPSSSGPWEMPWRVIMMGESLGSIVESTLVTDVSAPQRVNNPSWVRPGRVAWSWWSDPPSPQDGAKQCKFIDLAAEMGWEYVLVDANWTVMDNGTIHDVLRYAKSKNVGVLLWYNSGGPNNVVTEKPRDSMTYEEVRRFEFELLRKWGVKGVKIDFFQSDKQDTIKQYHGIMRDAAEQQIMLNFHGCTLPRGWERTYPHVMSMEAIRGSECYIFDPQFPARAPIQNTITPFSRNVIGPMDYTPVAFTEHNNPHITTSGHELALAVLFESSWLHFADKPEAYLNLPSAPKEFLKHVPVAWDDTRFIAGYPGQYAILARRKGDTWYLAGVNGQNQPREERIQLGNWMGAGNHELSLIADGKDARSFSSDRKSLKAGQSFGVKMLPHGGFVATLKPVR